MYEIDANKKAWSLLSKDHYEHYKKILEENRYEFNPIVLDELGDISGKKVLHLQCNTGADSIMLAKMGAVVTGVDLVPENIYYAEKMADKLDIENINFIESDIMVLMEKHRDKYDIVLTSDGAVGWIPDLKKWAETIKFFLKDDGYFYMHDYHPFHLVFDEDELDRGVLSVKYPYFKDDPDLDNYIGGYASEAKESENYFWLYKVSDLINSLSSAGLFVEYIHEYDRAVEGMAGRERDENDLMYYPEFEGGLPLTMSLKAVPR
ncbi:MAG: class I SAM-dependent methyltransferase [bacterium]